MTSEHHHSPLPIEVGLTAAIVAVRDDAPTILLTHPDAGSVAALPSGPFDPVEHRTFEIGLRAWVSEQTGAPLGYVEQLYTFGDRGRHAQASDRAHVVSVGYLALTRIGPEHGAGQVAASADFRPWYDFFPWEDWRAGRPPLLDAVILPQLGEWTRAAPQGGGSRVLSRSERVRLLFGGEESAFNEENVL